MRRYDLRGESKKFAAVDWLASAPTSRCSGKINMRADHLTCRMVLCCAAERRILSDGSAGEDRLRRLAIVRQAPDRLGEQVEVDRLAKMLRIPERVLGKLSALVPGR